MCRTLLILLVSSLLLSACNLFSGKNNRGKEGAVARVYDKYLYSSDLEGLVPKGTATNDSTDITTAFINDWIRQQLLLKQAEENLDESSKEFDRQIEQYRNSLLIYTYESKLVEQKLDTNVAMSEIEAYYQANQLNFQLRENMLQVNYVKVGKKHEAAGQVKKLLRSERAADKEKLHDLCEVNGFEYAINNGEWIGFSEFRSKIPLKNDDSQDYLRKRLYFEASDSASMYYVVIDDFKSKESISPLALEAGNIRRILLNKKKAEMLHQMEEDLYNDAIKRKKYEIYQKQP